MSDEPKKTQTKLSLRSAFAWLAVVLFVIYPISAIPAVVAEEWLVRFHVVNHETYWRGFSAAYAPVLWAIDHSPLLQRADDFFRERIRPSLTPR
jgi:hypothetical protein